MLFAVVAVALFFDFTNGFHDTANSIATTVSTRALGPREAVVMAAILNFAGAFVSFEVAATIAKGIVDQEAITLWDRWHHSWYCACGSYRSDEKPPSMNIWPRGR